jgi:hypothetical protein
MDVFRFHLRLYFPFLVFVSSLISIRELGFTLYTHKQLYCFLYDCTHFVQLFRKNISTELFNEITHLLTTWISYLGSMRMHARLIFLNRTPNGNSALKVWKMDTVLRSGSRFFEIYAWYSLLLWWRKRHCYLSS